jgi:thiol-disulfide isomerase/thioredoxin
MSKQLLKLLLVLLFSVSAISITIAEENKKIASLDEANTVEEILTFTNTFLESHAEKSSRDIEARTKFLREVGEIWVTGGEKILKIAKDKSEQEKGVQLKIDGLKRLIRVDQFGMTPNPNESTPSKHLTILNKLLDEFEEKGQYSSIVNKERFSVFLTEINPLYKHFSLEKFNEFVIRAKKLSTAKPEDYKKIYALFFIIINIAETAKGIDNNQELATNTAKDLIAFVNSKKSNLPAEGKKELIDRLEGYFLLRTVGSSPEIYGKTIDDTDFDWAALRGKYVLVKFTASWCGPCKYQIPGMLSAYEKYHDKGFEIVSIFIFDKLTETKKVIENEKLPWFIISEELTEKAGQQPQSKKYGVAVVPTMFLVGKDGKIIFTEAHGEALQKKLAELFPDEK